MEEIGISAYKPYHKKYYEKNREKILEKYRQKQYDKKHYEKYKDYYQTKNLEHFYIKRFGLENLMPFRQESMTPKVLLEVTDSK